MGREEAAMVVWNRYLRRLLPLVGRHLTTALRSRIDPEDVVQSALGSFFLRARQDQYVLERSGDLWRLLAAISLNKLKRQVERHTAGKRAITQEVAGVEMVKSIEPTPVSAVAVWEELAIVIQSMPPERREAIERYLAGEVPQQIATETSQSPRTVRRWVHALRDQLQRRLAPVPSPFAEVHAPLAREDYILKQHVGSGGFGKVYRAIEKKHGRTVAIKSLHKRRQCEPEAVRRFIQESQLLAKVSHPAIVGVHGLGQYPGGGYFLVMDWVAGENLQSRIDRSPLPLREAIIIVRRVADAVAAMHQRNVVHGDLKPANILVSHQGGVYVTDFGLASLRTRLTSVSSKAGGTLAYLAPEQLSDKPIDFPIDVYGLGGLFYAMLTGRHPRTGPVTDILQEIEQRIVPPRLGDLQPGFPRAIDGLVASCLAADPRERILSVSQFQKALEAIDLEQCEEPVS